MNNRLRSLLAIALSCAMLLTVNLSLSGCDDDEPNDPQVEEGQWSLVSTDLDEALLAVHGTSSTDVWAVGADKGAGPIVIHYDGTGWERIETGIRGDLWWVHAVENGPVFMAGANSTILRRDADGTLTRMTAPGVGAHTVYGLWARSADDVYAVGSRAGSRDGFVWHYDGQSWRNVPLPATAPLNAAGNLAGFFKVWGDADEVFVVGGDGRIFTRRGSDGALTLVGDGATERTLFTVHAVDDHFVAVGGVNEGVILEADSLDGLVATVDDVTPPDCPLLQGVYLSEDGEHGYATGFQSTIYRRAAEGQWQRVDHGLQPSAESLHAVWIDETGGVWSVGGNVISSRLDAGALIHYGTTPVVAYAPEKPEPPVPMPAVCPADQIDPHPEASIARRWNEANLNAIRRAIPRPGVHARNLFHTSVAMYDAWAAFDAVADGYLSRDKFLDVADPDAARREAISYAAYRLLTHRYEQEIGGPVSLACFDALMDKLGYDPTDTVITGDTPRAIGNRIGELVVATFHEDGANEANDYGDTTGYVSVNDPLVVDQPGAQANDPSRWQPLNLAVAVTQNGIVTEGQQGYIGPHWGYVTPFAMVRPADGEPYFDLGPGPKFEDAEMVDHVVEMIRRSSQLDPTNGTMMDISPGGLGNNSLGANDGQGHDVNPVTGQPYTPNMVPQGDFGRVLAEFWADGPSSETPPGHWNTLANTVSESPLLERRLFGEGEVVDELEWDAKVYFAVNGAVHDAAIAAWEAKRNYDSARPITLVRYMGGLGQRTDPALAAYHEQGLPLVDGLIELITEESAAPGERHAHLAPYIGQVAILAWRGEPGDRDAELGGVDWQRAVDWIPYQRRTFVSPGFPGFVSGHSTFSRSAAEVLTLLTGSPFFPGGLGEFVAEQREYLFFERGPSVEVRLQWASYYDAADQAGQSRIWGGIHVAPDDFQGRTIGSTIGIQAAELARTYYDGTAVAD